MSASRVLFHLVLGDFRERVRRYSFLLTLAFAVYLGLAAARGQISLRLGDYTGIPNSAWVGAVMSMTTTVFLSLTGFYIVSNSVHRDQQTRVGQILAATPMNNFVYTLAKALSNFAVLASMVAILAIAGVASILIRRSTPLDLWQLLAPFLFIALPTMALVAAVAVLFEVTPILRRVSSVVYFFLWIFMLAMATKHPLFDVTGINLISNQLRAALHAFDPSYEGGISFGMIVDHVGKAAHQRSFLWTGIPWSAGLMLHRMIGFPVAITVALAPALWFHRFDPAREWVKVGGRSKRLREVQLAEAAELAQTQTLPHVSQLSTAMISASSFSVVARLIACELRLLIARRKWWIYAIAAGLILAGFFTPLDEARHGLVAAIWLLPMLVWSRMGAREDLFATRSLILSAPGATLRPLLASWIAGALLPVVLASGVILRTAISGDLRSTAALIAGAFFAPALALALGNLARTPRLFEGIYISWWYVGPLQALPGADFVGVTNATAQPERYAVYALAAIAIAWGVREIRLRRA